MTENETVADPRPRVRAAAIVWGLIVMAIGTVIVAVVTDDERRESVARWITGLTPGDGVVVAVLVLGGILVLAGALAAIRGAQRPD